MTAALDSPTTRRYPYHQTTAARPAECGLIQAAICCVKSDTPQRQRNPSRHALPMRALSCLTL